MIAVEHDCLQLIDVKKKEIKRLSIKKDSTSDRDFLIPFSLNTRKGHGFCTIIRDYQLRPFDYSLEEQEELPVVTGMDTNTQIKILQIRIEEILAEIKATEKEGDGYQGKSKKAKKKFKYSEEKNQKEQAIKEKLTSLTEKKDVL